MDENPANTQPGWQEIEDYWLKYARLTTLGLLSSAIMHDTRNALTILSGNIQILLMKGESAGTPEIMERLEKSLHQVERIESQINRAESFSRRAEGAIQHIAPDSAVENALFFVEHYTKGLSRKVVTDLQPSEKRIACDVGLLEFAFGELLQLSFAERAEGNLFITSKCNGKAWECRIEQNAARTKTKDKLALQPGLLVATDALARMGGKIQRCSDEERSGFRLTVPWAKEPNTK